MTELAVVDGARPVLLRRKGASVYLLSGTAWMSVGGGLGRPVAAGANGAMLVGNGGAKLGSPGVVSYSTNGGTTWTQTIGLPCDQSVEAIAGQPGSSTVFAYCYGGDLYVTSDGGRAWTLLTRALRTKSG